MENNMNRRLRPQTLIGLLLTFSMSAAWIPAVAEDSPPKPEESIQHAAENNQLPAIESAQRPEEIVPHTVEIVPHLEEITQLPEVNAQLPEVSAQHTEVNALRPEETLVHLKELSSGLSPLVDLSTSNNIPEYCRVNGYRDSEESSAGGQIWTDNFASSLETREKTLLGLFFRLKKDPAAQNPAGDTYESIRAELKSHPVIDQEEAAACNKGLSAISGDSAKAMAGMGRPDQTSSVAGDYKAGFAQAAFACKDVSLSHLFACAHGLNIIQDIARPVDFITLIDIWQQVVNDPVYYRVLQTLALEMIDQLEQKKAPEGHLFDDLKRLFLKEVKDQRLAEEYTWKTMGFLATSGSNLTYHASRVCGYTGNRALLQVFHVISTGAPVLDRLSAAKGSLYSYPKQVQVTCDYGKEYHFWMTAYLAREVAKRTGNIDAAAAAAFTADKGYQFMTVTPGRDRTKPFRENAFSNYNNNMRLDLTQAAAGAWFGATSLNDEANTVNSQTYEAGIRNTFAGVQPIEVNPDFKFPSSRRFIKLLRTYSNWKKVINPDAPFFYFKKEMRK
jgi:hypothetical protein